MKAKANALVTILRGTETNSYGDTVDSDVAIYTGVRAAISEQNRRTYLPAEQATRVVRSYICRVGREVDLRKDDRLRDEGNGRTYLVTDLSEPSGLNGDTPDFVATLSRTT